MEKEGPITDIAARQARRAAKAVERKANPRTTNAQRLASLRLSDPTATRATLRANDRWFARIRRTVQED